MYWSRIIGSEASEVLPRGIFDFSGYLAHGRDFLWKPEILWPAVVGDGLTALTCFFLTGLLLFFARRRRDLPYAKVLPWGSALFLLVGVTHVLGLWTVWVPAYPVSAAAKLAAGTASAAAAVAVALVVPRALALKNPAELEAVNRRLEREAETSRARERTLRETNLRLEELVRLRTKKWRNATREMDQFAYVASHDLQEPLRMITSYCELLKEELDGKLSADQDLYLKFASDGARRMKELIDDLLLLSRMGRGGEPDLREPGAALEEAEISLQSPIEESGARISHGDLPPVRIAQADLVSLFQNLIGNAIKYRDRSRTPEIRVAGKKDGRWVEFAVEDNGIGIEEQYFERIFRVFERLHSRSDFPGTGMGLAICRKIVESQGGRIRVESQPGRGTRILFTLPA